MKKKMIWVIAIALILVCVIAYAATHMVALDKQKKVETAEKTEIVDLVQPDEAIDALGEEAGAEVFELGGEITEIADSYIVIVDRVNGPVQVNLGDDTLYDGADLEELAVGQFIQVMYDGKMTRSIPAQVYALKVGLYPVSGVVKEAGEVSVTLFREEIGDEVIVNLPEGVAAPAAGSSVIAYTNGVMTMSIPAQTTAIGIVVQ